MKNKLLNCAKINFRNMPFRYKLTLFLVITICITAFIQFLSSYIVTSRSIKQQAKDMTMLQLEQNTSNLQNYLNQIERTPDSIVTDNSLQEYLSKPDENTMEFTNIVDDVYQTLSNVFESKENLLYIYLYKAIDDDRVLYLGPTKAGRNADYSNVKKYISSDNITGSPIKASFRKDPIISSRYTFAIYQPIFDKYKIKKPIGMLCLSVAEESLTRFYSHGNSNMPLETYIVNSRGIIVSHTDKSKISTDAHLRKILAKKDGSTEIDGKIVVYKYFEDWDWYVIGTLPLDYILRDNNVLSIIIILIVVLTVLAAIIISFIFSKRLLKPFDELIYRMSMVSNGDFTTHIELSPYGYDFNQVSQGFNKMVEQINVLMDKIYNEQRQLKEIEFKALQAQINPHFLYNTLESIHWQALLGGNYDISTMVKALAGFYRISLSGGEDIIPLKSETEHVENYMTIQEIRYKDKMESYIDIPEEFYDVKIPKMTLQPLVENSIYHGLKGKEVKGFIKITAVRDGDDLIVKTIDNGIGMSESQIANLNKSLEDNESSTGGYGVRNVHRRIRLFFGEPYGIFYESNEYGGVTANVRLHLKT